MSANASTPPGFPGIPPKWTSSSKEGIGTAINAASRVWFTFSHGILNEIYYPRVDQACVRDMGFIVTDGEDFFSEEKRATVSNVEHITTGVPAFRITNICTQGRYRIVKEIITDPHCDALMQQITFEPLQDRLDDYHLFALLSPHLGNQGSNNTAWRGDYKGVPMLFAERDGVTLAFACSAPWLKTSVGYVGTSDGWQDITIDGVLTHDYAIAKNGNVAITAEIDLAQCGGTFLSVIAFGGNAAEAGNHARTSLLSGFEHALNQYSKEWVNWRQPLRNLPDANHRCGQSLYEISLKVLKTHEDKHFPGGLIASLSIPWGMDKGDNDLGGYHLVWPRDLVETAGGFLAAGCYEDVKRVLIYLAATQWNDGHWSQNMWLDGTPYWDGIQMDETAFPILLVDLALREEIITASQFWPMVKKAASYVAQHGPVTQQDRWEEDAGYSPFTLAVEISALLIAADLAETNEAPDLARYLRETADIWNANIEMWTYASDTELSRQAGVGGYYVRIAPEETADAPSPMSGFVPIKNRSSDNNNASALQIISPDALALVRFGLRSALDPRILNTLKVIDYLLKVETPVGPGWYRYNMDGYGEHEDGSAFNGTGIGRLWPLLTAERGHYEVAAGNLDSAKLLLKTVADFSSQGGMIPEQVWDQPDLADKELFFGKPSGSAMPLVWAHAEYIKLLRSIQDGAVFDRPEQTYNRYAHKNKDSPFETWRNNHKCRLLIAGKILRIETLAATTVHWSFDDWANTQDTPSCDTGAGVHVVDIDSSKLNPGAKILFTFHWQTTGRWEGRNFYVEVVTHEVKAEQQKKCKQNLALNNQQRDAF